MLKSKESNIRAFVKFTNTSHRLVQVQWVNFSGENVHYKDLEPRQSCVVSERTHCAFHTWPFYRFTFFMFLDQHILHSSVDLCLPRLRRETANQPLRGFPPRSLVQIHSQVGERSSVSRKARGLDPLSREVLEGQLCVENFTLTRLPRSWPSGDTKVPKSWDPASLLGGRQILRVRWQWQRRGKPPTQATPHELTSYFKPTHDSFISFYLLFYFLYHKTNK